MIILTEQDTCMTRCLEFNPLVEKERNKILMMLF